MPGTGIQVPSRYTTSAARVNQMRFLSSVALEKTPRFMFAASCSAADAIPLLSRTRQNISRGRLPVRERPRPITLLRLTYYLGRGFGSASLLRRRDHDRTAGLLDRRLGRLG